MVKFNIQDRIVLDDMVNTFTEYMIKHHDKCEKDGKRPIITYNYWKQMMAEVQSKIDNMTTKKALYHSRKYR